MRQVLIGITLATVIARSAAAQPPASQGHQHQGMMMPMETPWRELNGFHSILHLSHQAMMKNGDLAPARRNASLLAKAMDTWAGSTAPAACHLPADIGDKLTALGTATRAYASLVEAQATDDEVKSALNGIHDQFMVVHRGCMPMDHKGMGTPPRDSAR